MALVYCANCPGLNQFDDAAIILAGMYLRAHLCRLPFVFLSQLCDCARLKNRVRERLFAIDVLAQTQRPGGRGCVGVVRRAHHDRINIFLIEQLAKIIVSFRARKFLFYPG